MSRRRSVFPLLIASVLILPAWAFAQKRAPLAIRTDTVWRGQIDIENDVSIYGAQLRVEPGTTVRFVSKGKGPVIRLVSPLFVSGERSRPARLVLAGEAEHPVVFETPEGYAPGSIEGRPGATAVIDARFAEFRRLGEAAGDQARPAIVAELCAAGNDLWLTSCRFTRCSMVHAEMISSQAGAEVASCTFDQTVGPTALILAGSGLGVKVIRDNVSDAGLEIATPQTLVENNIVIGEHGDIAVRRGASEGVRIALNYVHCTSAKDIGRYAMRCESPATIVENNVLSGGTYVFETAPRTVRKNVIIGAANLVAQLASGNAGEQGPEIRTEAHALVTNICPDAVVAENLLLGAAHASISLTGRCGGVRIERNVFDGWNSARRAIDLDVTATGEGNMTLAGNIFIGYRKPPISSEAKRGPALAADANVFVGFEGLVYEGFAASGVSVTGERRVSTLLDAGGRTATLAGSSATQEAVGVDELLRSGRKTVAEVHRQWFANYGR